MDNASADPMSSPALLSRLFRDYENQDKHAPYPSHFSALARNPSLPPQIFTALVTKLEEYEDTYVDVLSYFFFNPSITFEQVLSIVMTAQSLKYITRDVNFEQCSTVVEIFDELLPLAGLQSIYALSRLLCSPLVTVEDFRLRIEKEIVKPKPKLDNWIVFSSSHFIPTSNDYSRALNDLSSMKSSEFERGLAIVRNKNATPEFLRDALERTGKQANVVEWIYENLNCPIELSARFYSENIEDYRWKPSFYVPLERKVDEYLFTIGGQGPWEALPFIWKLQMIAE